MKTKYGIVILVAVLALTGCGKSAQMPVSGESMEPVSATLLNTKGEEIGKAHLEEQTEGVTISLQAEGLSPGIHGIHIHETGVCTPPDFESAGAHLNPAGKQHGFENPKGFHAGDLPNIEVPEDGKVVTQITTAEVTLKKGSRTRCWTATAVRWSSMRTRMITKRIQQATPVRVSPVLP